MKRTIINLIAALAVLAGLALSVIAPWWVVWLICFPVMYAGVITSGSLTYRISSGRLK